VSGIDPSFCSTKLFVKDGIKYEQIEFETQNKKNVTRRRNLYLSSGSLFHFDVSRKIFFKTDDR